MNDNQASDSRFQRLLPLIASDPENSALLADAAEAAIAEGDAEAAAKLLDERARRGPLPPELANLAGLAALRLNRFDAARRWFGELVAAGETAPAVRFNLAWAYSMERDYDAALAQLSDDVARELPQAAMLQIQLLHEMGEFDAAANRARDYVEVHPDYGPLMAAVSVLALDVEDEELALRCATKAPDHPDSLTTLGTLRLGDDRAEEALELFERALVKNPGSARATIGRGLARLAGGERQAAADLDRGAEMFEDHLGSWLAAGWAHFLGGDSEAARSRFEHALALDDTFAEVHGSLAVLDVAAGDADRARARSEVALRLDRQCYSAALAQSMLAAGAGDGDRSRRIFETAINTPVDKSGRTIAQALVRLGTRPG